MKLLEALNNDSFFNSPAIALRGDCVFQRQLFLQEFQSFLNPDKILFKTLTIDTSSLSYEQILNLGINRQLYSKKTLYVLDTPSLLKCEHSSKPDLSRLWDACKNPKDKNLRFCWFLPWKHSIPNSLKEDLVDCESNNKKSLTSITSHLIEKMGLDVSGNVADILAESFLKEPLNIFSELKKIQILLSEEMDINLYLKTLNSSSDDALWGLLDALGIRNLKRALSEYDKVSSSHNSPRDMSELLISQVKFHFRKLLFLKQMIDEKQMLNVAKHAHDYLTANSYRQKQEFAASFRELLTENHDEDSELVQKFNTQFKSDYYLAKLLFQQRYFSYDELLKSLQHCNKTHSLLHSSSLPIKTLFNKLFFAVCK
jgi:hypothetical protein